MYGHLVAVSESASAELDSMSDDQLFALLNSPEAANIDKSWQAAFPLVGSIAGTGMMLVDDPRPIGGDLGFGSAMFIEPGQVRAIAAKLQSADDAVVNSHWATLDSPFIQSGLYDDEGGKGFAMDGYRRMVEVFVNAAATSAGVLFAIM